jgi:hypothetical protein
MYFTCGPKHHLVLRKLRIKFGNTVRINLHRQTTFFRDIDHFLTNRLVDIPAEQHSIILNIDDHPQNVKSYCVDDLISYGNRFPFIKENCDNHQDLSLMGLLIGFVTNLAILTHFE